MSDLLDLGELPVTQPTLAGLRAEMNQAQAEAVEALRCLEVGSGDDEGAEALAGDCMKADRLQSALLMDLYALQERDEYGDYYHPLSPAGQATLKLLRAANDKLNDLRMAMGNVRAKEIEEIDQLKEGRV